MRGGLETFVELGKDWWPFGREEETPTAGPGEQILLPDPRETLAGILEKNEGISLDGARRFMRQAGLSDREIDALYAELGQ